MKTRNIFDVEMEKIQAHGGQGQIDFARVLGVSEAPLPDDSSINFVDVAILPPNTSVGLHTHHASTEIYLVMEGEGQYWYNGETLRVKPGDVLVNHCGRHSLLNDGEHALKIFVIETETKAAE